MGVLIVAADFTYSFAVPSSISKDLQYTIVKSKGMKEMLKGFLFFDFMRQIKYKNTTQGQVVNSSDTSQNVVYGSLYKYLNEATATYQAIQDYIQLIEPGDYILPVPAFNGVKKEI